MRLRSSSSLSICLDEKQVIPGVPIKTRDLLAVRDMLDQLHYHAQSNACSLYKIRVPLL